MSTQVSRVKGFGYKFDYDENLFGFIDNIEEETEFIDIIDMDYSYYDIKKDKTSERKLKIVSDGMSGEYKYVLYLEEASYLENTHGDEFWCNKYLYDSWVKEYAKEQIEILLQRKLGEPKEFDFQHWE